jgi:hypothetical protein
LQRKNCPNFNERNQLAAQSCCRALDQHVPGVRDVATDLDWQLVQLLDRLYHKLDGLIVGYPKKGRFRLKVLDAKMENWKRILR